MAACIRILVAGSRSIKDKISVFQILEEQIAKLTSSGLQPIIVSGAAVGVDSLAAEYARQKDIPLEEYPITPMDWKTYGRAAGPRRNALMAQNADVLIAFWDGYSPGTKNMIQHMKKRNKNVIQISLQ